jgi:phosphoribosyl 1,2-cyclic phosphodiesterase
MEITVWGARGSVPVSGPEYVRHGGDTTCVEVRTKTGEIIILDAGTGIRSLGNRILREDHPSRDIHLFLTHAHWDHIMGFPFFRPLYRKGFRLHLQGCSSAQESIHAFLEETMRPPFFPISLKEVGAGLQFSVVCAEEFEVGGVRIASFPLNHPNQGVGFRLTEGDRRFAFFPDNELTFEHPGGKSFDEYAAFVEGVDLLVHDAEYRRDEYERLTRSWGHSVFLDTVRLAAKAGARTLLLWHLNQDRTDGEVDAMVREARAARPGGSELDVEAAATGMVVRL